VRMLELCPKPISGVFSTGESREDVGRACGVRPPRTTPLRGKGVFTACPEGLGVWAAWQFPPAQILTRSWAEAGASATVECSREVGSGLFSRNQGRPSIGWDGYEEGEDHKGNFTFPPHCGAPSIGPFCRLSPAKRAGTQVA
jgi:hypothetical protein